MFGRSSPPIFMKLGVKMTCIDHTSGCVLFRIQPNKPKQDRQGQKKIGCNWTGVGGGLEESQTNEIGSNPAKTFPIMFVADAIPGNDLSVYKMAIN